MNDSQPASVKNGAEYPRTGGAVQGLWGEGSVVSELTKGENAPEMRLGDAVKDIVFCTVSRARCC